jgi:hypothetical protein
VADAQAATTELEGAADKAARDAILDAKAPAYRAFREWLSGLSDGKCWFTEADDKASHMEVEHYRPKKVARDLDGNEREGYWWLAFEWRNLRLAGNIPNRRKGGYFPLRAGCPCATSDSRALGGEEPYLLDPADPRDPTLLDFDQEGKPRSSSLADRNEWDKARVEISIKRYCLDHPQLEEGRKALWNQLARHVNEYANSLLDGSPRALGRAEEILNQLRAACRSKARFSRAARTYLRMLNAELALGLLETN